MVLSTHGTCSTTPPHLYLPLPLSFPFQFSLPFAPFQVPRFIPGLCAHRVTLAHPSAPLLDSFYLSELSNSSEWNAAVRTTDSIPGQSWVRDKNTPIALYGRVKVTGDVQVH